MSDRDAGGRFIKGATSWCAGLKTGRVPWNAGRGEWRDCKVCSAPKWFQNCELSRPTAGQFCSKACFYKGRVCTQTFKGGDRHPAWIDGTSKKSGYTSEFSSSLKTRIKKRDGFICQLCGITEANHKLTLGRALSVNHIDFNKKNYDERNLNTLCVGCNTKINWDRPKWTAYFQQQMEARFGK